MVRPRATFRVGFRISLRFGLGLLIVLDFRVMLGARTILITMRCI